MRTLFTTASSVTFTQCAPKATEFGEITQNKAVTPFKVIQGHRFGTNRKLIYDFLLLINTNLPSILNHFRDIAFDRSKIAIFAYPSCVYLPPTEDFPWDNLRKFSVDVNGWPKYQMA